MTKHSTLQAKHSFEKDTTSSAIAVSSYPTDYQGRLSLRNARSGNSLTSNLSGLSLASAAYSPRTSISSACSAISSYKRGNKSSSELSVLKRRVRTTALSTASLPITPPNDGSDINTPGNSISKSIPSSPCRNQTYQLITPTKHRAIIYGAVVDTPPSSTDRYIPSRGRDDASINNYRANKPFFELTPEEKQIRLYGAIEDPFMARRVTPQFYTRRNASSGRYSQARTMSAGGVWSIGRSVAHTGPVVGIHTGRGLVLGSGTNARMFKSDFFDRETAKESHERFEGRLAMALDLDRFGKVFDFSCSTKLRQDVSKPGRITQWKDGEWASQSSKFTLDATTLRDDYYCTLLAYCPAANVLAVGLENRAYIWSESRGVQNQALPDPEENECHITSLAFSSPGAARSILAIGRSDGRLNLWSVHEKQDRIKHILPRPVGCLAFKPVPTRRFSERINSVTFSEEILVGDERGDIYYYSLEWPKLAELTKPASLNLLAKISIHRQQVCGLVWSPDGQYFATGGNDNVCFLLSVQDILRGSLQDQPFRKPIKIPGMSPYAPDFIPNRDAHYTISPQYSPHSSESASNDSVASRAPVTSQNAVLTIGPDCARHCWQHSAAVKAIAFCPWQKGLIATGGGSNDRAIHFFHMKSGACLATIEVHAQVTSLIWSKTKREICATFGYSQPDHPFRIAVFSWPDCRQVVRIPWKDSMRALYAIPYPGGPNKERKDSNTKGKGRSKTRKRPKNTEGGTWWSRTKEEGCIVVASSDQSVKFHEVWSGHSTSMGARTGGLAWSSILESEEGGDIDFGGRDIIR